MRIFLAGATGAIGKRLVPRLLGEGHVVVASTRSSAGAAELVAQGIEAVLLDPYDERAVTQAVVRAEPEVVIHQLTALNGKGNLKKFDRDFAETNRLRTEGLDYLLRAARAADARRFIAQSFTGWTNIRADGPVKTEEDPLDPSPPRAQSQTLAALRYVEETVTAGEGIEGIALRYGIFYGPGTSLGEAGEYPELVRKRKFPVVGSGMGRWSLVHIDDAAQATVLALDHGSPGVYNIVDDQPVAVDVWLPYLASVLGAKPPRRIPVWLGKLAIGEVGISMMTQIRGSSNEKAKRELGFRPRYPTFREGFRNGLADTTSGTGTSPEQLAPVTGA